MSPLTAAMEGSRAAARLAGQRLCTTLDDRATPAGVHRCVLFRGDLPYLRQEITIRAGAGPLAQANADQVFCGQPLR